MSAGMIILMGAAILVFFGTAQRVLDKLAMSDRTALLLLALMFLGTLVPNLTIGPVSISVGGALIPLGVCVYLMIHAGTAKERWRAVIGSLLTGGVIYALSALLPNEPERMRIDPMYLYGLTGGLIAYILGRSRRCAFICGVMGILLSDIATAVVSWSRGVDQTLNLGGAGVFDAVVISGVLGVILAELAGELIERLVRGAQPPVRTAVRTHVKHKEK